MRHRRAFTLVELLIVIIIIAVLAAVIVPKFGDSSLRGREATLRLNLSLVRKAIEEFQQGTGLWPKQLSDIKATTAPAQGIDSGGNLKALPATPWTGPYLEGSLIDPIAGVQLQYKTTPPKVGTVSSAASGNASDGTAYSSW